MKLLPDNRTKYACKQQLDKENKRALKILNRASLLVGGGVVQTAKFERIRYISKNLENRAKQAVRKGVGVPKRKFNLYWFSFCNSV